MAVPFVMPIKLCRVDHCNIPNKPSGIAFVFPRNCLPHIIPKGVPLPTHRAYRPACSLKSFPYWRVQGESVTVHWIYLLSPRIVKGLPRWLSNKGPSCQCWRCGFNRWVRKIPPGRKWQPTLVFLPGKSPGQRSLVGYSPCGCKRVRHDLATKQ